MSGRLSALHYFLILQNPRRTIVYKAACFNVSGRHTILFHNKLMVPVKTCHMHAEKQQQLHVCTKLLVLMS